MPKRKLTVNDFKVGDTVFFLSDDISKNFSTYVPYTVDEIDTEDIHLENKMWLNVGGHWFSTRSANVFLLHESLIDDKDLFQIKLGNTKLLDKYGECLKFTPKLFKLLISGS